MLKKDRGAVPTLCFYFFYCAFLLPPIRNEVPAPHGATAGAGRTPSIFVSPFYMSDRSVPNPAVATAAGVAPPKLFLHQSHCDDPYGPRQHSPTLPTGSPPTAPPPPRPNPCAPPPAGADEGGVLVGAVEGGAGPLRDRPPQEGAQGPRAQGQPRRPRVSPFPTHTLHSPENAVFLGIRLPS